MVYYDIDLDVFDVGGRWFWPVFSCGKWIFTNRIAVVVVPWLNGWRSCAIRMCIHTPLMTISCCPPIKFTIFFLRFTQKYRVYWIFRFERETFCCLNYEISHETSSFHCIATVCQTAVPNCFLSRRQSLIWERDNQKQIIKFYYQNKPLSNLTTTHSS